MSVAIQITRQKVLHHIVIDYKKEGFCKVFSDKMEEIKQFDSNDIVGLLDLDDCLLEDAIDTVLKIYNDTGCWLTYGNFKCESGHTIIDSRFKQARYFNNYFRRMPWMASHFKTFKLGLYKNLPENWCINSVNNKYYIAAGDVALMIPMMEMAGLDRIQKCEKIIYQYNNTNPLNDHKINKNAQWKAFNDIKNRSPLNRIENL